MGTAGGWLPSPGTSTDAVPWDIMAGQVAPAGYPQLWWGERMCPAGLLFCRVPFTIVLFPSFPLVLPNARPLFLLRNDVRSPGVPPPPLVWKQESGARHRLRC